MKNALALLYHPSAVNIEEEFLDDLFKKSVREGEEGLMLAVLEDAVACFQKYVSARDSKGKGTFRDAEEWILEEERDWLFSFNNICEVLGFDPQYVRKGLMRWKETRLAERPKAKVYRLTPKRRRRKSRETDPSRSGQKWLKAVGR